MKTQAIGKTYAILSHHLKNDKTIVSKVAETKTKGQDVRIHHINGTSQLGSRPDRTGHRYDILSASGYAPEEMSNWQRQAESSRLALLE